MESERRQKTTEERYHESHEYWRQAIVDGRNGGLEIYKRFFPFDENERLEKGKSVCEEDLRKFGKQMNEHWTAAGAFNTFARGQRASNASFEIKNGINEEERRNDASDRHEPHR